MSFAIAPEPLPRITGLGPAGFVQGALVPLRAAGFLLARPQLWVLVVVPVMLNALLLAGLFLWGFASFSDWFRELFAGRDAWYWQPVHWLGPILFGALALVMVYFIFTPLALLIAAPFNDVLAERVERQHGFGLHDTRPMVPALVSDVVFSLLNELKRLGLVLGVFALLLPLNLVPVVGNVAYVAASLVWGAWCVGLEFTSFAADRRRVGLGEKWAMLRRHRAAAFGFGFVTVGLLLVPFVNVLTVAVSAVGGTMLFGALTEGERAGGR